MGGCCGWLFIQYASESDPVTSPVTISDAIHDSLAANSQPPNPSDLLSSVERVFSQIPTIIIDGAIAVIKELTGIDLTSEVNFLESLATQIESGVQSALDLLHAILQPLVDAIVSVFGPIPIIGSAVETLANFLGFTKQTADAATVNIQATQNAVQTGATGVPTTDATGDTVQAAVANTAAQIAANAAALNALQTRSDGGANSGLVWGDEIETVQATGLDPAFWDSGQYTEGDATIGFIAVLDGHNAGMVQVSAANAATQFFVYTGTNATSLTDYQNSKVVSAESMPSPGPLETRWASQDIYCRVSADKLSWVRVRFRSDGVVQFEYRVAGGTIAQLGATQGGVSPFGIGQTFGIEAGVGATVNAFRATINGKTVHQVTDSGNVTQVGSGFRGMGWGQRLDFGYPPGKITQFGGNDNQPVPTVGCGVNIFRANPATVGQGVNNTTPVAFAANFWDFIEDQTPGFTVNLATGGIMVLNDGWYMFTLRGRLQDDTAIPTGRYVGYSLLRDKHQGAGQELVRHFNVFGAGGTLQAESSGSICLYVHGGEEFFAATISNLVSFALGGGDANGVQCYFGITLMNNTT